MFTEAASLCGLIFSALIQVAEGAEVSNVPLFVGIVCAGVVVFIGYIVIYLFLWPKYCQNRNGGSSEPTAPVRHDRNRTKVSPAAWSQKNDETLNTGRAVHAYTGMQQAPQPPQVPPPPPPPANNQMQPTSNPFAAAAVGANQNQNQQSNPFAAAAAGNNNSQPANNPFANAAQGM